MLRRLSLVFSAGAVGGLCNSLVAWAAGAAGATTALGVGITPALSAPWLYPRIVWGGLWGALFLIPTLRRSPVGRGLLMSLGPTLIQLLVVFPLKAKQGMFGLELGLLTPAFVLVFNAAWGVSAALWLSLTGEGK